MGNTPADQFLDAFNEIETWLQGTLQEDKTTGFAQLVRQQASRTSGPVRTHKDDLLEFADLRNAIVHSERAGGEVIADPRSAVVEKISHIRDAIIDPPSVIPGFGGDVTTVREDDSLSRVVRKMQERNYSQVPVHQGPKIEIV
jgi:CBS domain containing-hemolysin-like protein